MRGARTLRGSRFQDLGRSGLWSVDGVVWLAEAVCEVARFRAPGWRCAGRVGGGVTACPAYSADARCARNRSPSG